MPALISKITKAIANRDSAEHYLDMVSGDVMSAFSAALDEIRGLDWSIDQVSIPHLQYALGAELAIFSSEASAYHRKTMAASADLYSSDLRRELDAGMVFLATDYILVQRIRRIITQEFRPALQSVDLLASTAIPIMAPRIGEATDDTHGPSFLGARRHLESRLSRKLNRPTDNFGSMRILSPKSTNRPTIHRHRFSGIAGDPKRPARTRAQRTGIRSARRLSTKQRLYDQQRRRQSSNPRV